MLTTGIVSVKNRRRCVRERQQPCTRIVTLRELQEGPTVGSDIEVLFSQLPEPIDLELDPGRRFIYWTDRGDNTISRAPMDPQPGHDPAARRDREILVSGLQEAIGITLDLPRGTMYYTSLTGEIGAAKLDGKGARDIRPKQGRLTGIALLE
jgi:hypothetical protein